MTMKRERGLKIPEMFDAAVEGRLKAMWIFGYDIAQSDPDTAHVIARARSRSTSSSCQEIFENETTKFADVILPASSFLEKTGTFTNAERRLQLVRAGRRPARRGEDRPRDLQAGLGARSATSMPLGRPEDVMDEIAELTPRLRRRHATSGSDERGLQWPVAPDGTDTPILCEDAFALPDGRARFAAAALQAARRRGRATSSR